jgi:Holliday junction resolvasome RuvABC endonuclease subunit
MALGIDPGWAKCGIAAIASVDGTYRSAGVRLVRTSPNKDKRFEHLRVAADDERRLREYYEAFCESIEKVKPHVIGVEVYTIREVREYEQLRDAAAAFLSYVGLGGKAAPPFSTAMEFVTHVGGAWEGFMDRCRGLARAVDAFRVVRGRGAAAKTYGVYTTAMCAAYRYGVPIYPFMATDLKKRATGQVRATKKAVEDALCQVIEGLREDVDTNIKAKKMHEHLFDAGGHGLMALEAYQKWVEHGLRLRSEQEQGNLCLT